MLKRFKLPVIAFVACMAFSVLAGKAKNMVPKAAISRNDEQLTLISKLTAAILSRNHYRQHKLNNEYSKKILMSILDFLIQVVYTSPKRCG